MNGAHALLATLKTNGVTVCFANPGTSEMHFVAALDDEPGVHGVLCLFEGVATGAADGYARITGTPAATLLHLGPGLANGWANLHNARRAHVPVINIVGDHATYHGAYDAPLQSDLESLARSIQGWYHRCLSPDTISRDVANAISASHGPPAQIATLALPADVSWSDLTAPSATWELATPARALAIDETQIGAAVQALRSQRCAIFLGGSALSKAQLSLAQRVISATGSSLLMETFPTIMDRGTSVVSPERLIYLSEFASAQLKEVDALILVGANEPVSFFAYPNLPSRLVTADCEVIRLAPPGSCTLDALNALVDSLKAPSLSLQPGERVGEPTGDLTTQTFAQAVGATLPDGVIVIDESNTSGVHLFGATRHAPEHQWATLTGGAIGYGLPVALGAGVASRRRVLALESDGSMMYTPQALWTMAREQLDVTIVALSNRSYAVLNMELSRVGAVSHGAASARMLELDDPELNLASVASAQGVPSTRVTSAQDLVTALRRSFATPGPTLIEAMLPAGLR
ncbi:MAG: acetolactate synthase large subunit [Acidimicrobiales bacterium]